MFATTYYTDDVRARYLSSLTRVRQAEAEYVAYLAQQDRARLRDAQRRASAGGRGEKDTAGSLVASGGPAGSTAYTCPPTTCATCACTKTSCCSSAPRTARGRPVRAAQEPPTPERVQNALTRRLASETDPEVHATIQQLLSTLSASSSSSSTEAVRAALERRLAGERNPEVHSTIRCLLARLAPATSTPTPSPSTAKALAEIQTLERALRTLVTGFVFPARLDFVISSSAPSSSDALPPTPRNAPVRQYAHALNALLARLDAVDSAGDETVRARRRAVVGRVEAALGEVERVVEGRWKLFGMGSASAPASSPRPPRPVSPVAAVLDSLEGAQAAEGPSSSPLPAEGVQTASVSAEPVQDSALEVVQDSSLGDVEPVCATEDPLPSSSSPTEDTVDDTQPAPQSSPSIVIVQNSSLDAAVPVSSEEQETVSPILNAYVDEASANEPAQSSRSTAVVQDASLDAAVPVSSEEEDVDTETVSSLLNASVEDARDTQDSSPRAESEAGPSAVVVVGDSAHLPTENTTQDSDLHSEQEEEEQEPLSLSVVAGVDEEAVVVEEEEDEHEDTTQDSDLDSELEEQEQEPLSLSMVAGVHEEAVVVEEDSEEDEHELIDAEDEDADSASSWSEVDA